MGNFSFIVSIIVLIFGVLQIILFFKIWSMTNDIKKIANKTTCKNYNYYILKGCKEDLAKVLEEDFITDLSDTYTRVGFISGYMDEIIQRYINLFKTYNITFPEKYKDYIDLDKLATILK